MLLFLFFCCLLFVPAQFCHIVVYTVLFCLVAQVCWTRSELDFGTMASVCLMEVDKRQLWRVLPAAQGKKKLPVLGLQLCARTMH